MKLRARVHRGRWSGRWRVSVLADGRFVVSSAYRRTYAEALDLALTEVGLATPPEHREAP